MLRLASIALSLVVTSAAPATAQNNVLARLIDTICIDLTEDIGCEQVTLLASAQGEPAADLYIYPNVHLAPSEPILVVRNAVFSGAMFGDTPMLERSPSGALQILTEQISSGRDPWTEIFTIVTRDGRLLVAGRTFSTYDRIANSTFRCDVNLLTGDYEASGNGPVVDGVPSDDFTQAGRTEATDFDLAMLSYQEGPAAPCHAIRNSWFWG